MVKRVVLLIIVLIFALVHPGLVTAANGTGTIDGTLVNGTTDGVNIANQTVTLEIYQNTLQTSLQATTTDNNGNFSFAGLVTDPAYSYEVVTTYLNIKYRNGPLVFDSGVDTIPVKLDIFEVTNDGQAISIMLAHAVVSLQDNTLMVKEYYLIANTGDHTFIGDNVDGSQNKATLKFTLPAGAQELQTNTTLNSSFIAVDNGNFFDTVPVSPGMKEVNYTYKIPFNSANSTLSWKVNYPLNQFDFLLIDPNVAVSGDKLTKQDSLTINNRTYQHYSSANLKVGDIITARLSSLSATSSPSTFSPLWLLLIPLVGGGVFLVVRRKKTPSSDTMAIDNSSRENLLEEIAKLDDEFENGTISKKEYLKLRSEKKQKLIDLI